MTQTYSSVLITGATSGIGEELAKQFALKCDRLILTGRNFSKLQSLQETLSIKTKVEIISCELKSSASREILCGVIEEIKPELLINNAGFGLYGDAISHSVEEEMDILRVDGEAVLELTLRGAKALLASGKKGVILNVSSVASFFSFPKMATYAASKAFVTAFSEGLYYELKDKGIYVLAFCPGVVSTNFRKRASKGNSFEAAGEIVLPLEETAKAIIHQIETKKPLVIFNWKYRMLVSLSKLLPRNFLAHILQKSMADILNRKEK